MRGRFSRRGRVDVNAVFETLGPSDIWITRDSTIRTFSSAGTADGLSMIDQAPSHSRTRKKRVLPQSLSRDHTTLGRAECGVA